MTLSSALLVTIFAIGGGTPAQMSEDLENIFEDESYAFCHDEKLALFPLEREYCEVVGKRNEVCPALPEVCKNELPKDFKWSQRGRLRVGRDGADYGPKDDKPDDGEETDGSGNGRNGSGSGSGDGSGNGSGKDGNGKGSGKNGSGNGKGDGPGKDGSSKDRDKGKDKPKEADKSKDDAAKTPPPPPEEPSPPIAIPGWLAGLARILFYVLIAVLLGVIGYYIYKNLMEGREDKDKPDESPDDDAPKEEAPEVPRGPVETDVDRLLARARAAAQRGDFKQAIEDSYAALLRRLEGDGIIDLHPSRTNGDYVRSLRDRDELRQAVRSIATDVEKVQFGSETPNPTLFESVYSRVLPLCGRIAAIALLLLAAGNLSSCRDDVRPTDPDVLMLGGGVKKGGASGSGLGAVAEILKKNDIDTTFVLTKDQKPSGGAKGIVLMPGAKVDRDQWKALRSWVRDGGTLIVAGHRPDLSKDFKIEEAASAGPGPIRTVPGSVYDAYGHELALPYVSQLTGSFTRWETILTRNKETYALLNGDSDAVGAGRIIVFADDRLFANLAMALGDNASYLVTLLHRCDVKDLEFWDSIRGSGASGGDGSDGGGADGDEQGSGSGSGGEGADNPIDSLKNARLLPIMLQLLALVLLFVLWKGTRFGTPRDPKEESRRAFADHTRALGMTYARAKASRHASGLFSVWAIDRLRERLLGGARGGLSQLAEAISQRTGRPIGEVMQVLMEATGAREEVAPPSSFRPGASAPPPPQSPPQSGSARDFWIMEELSRYLAATKSAPARGKR